METKKKITKKIKKRKGRKIVIEKYDEKMSKLKANNVRSLIKTKVEKN